MLKFYSLWGNIYARCTRKCVCRRRSDGEDLYCKIMYSTNHVSKIPDWPNRHEGRRRPKLHLELDVRLFSRNTLCSYCGHNAWKYKLVTFYRRHKRLISVNYAKVKELPTTHGCFDVRTNWLRYHPAIQTDRAWVAMCGPSECTQVIVHQSHAPMAPFVSFYGRSGVMVLKKQDQPPLESLSKVTQVRGWPWMYKPE